MKIIFFIIFLEILPTPIDKKFIDIFGEVEKGQEKPYDEFKLLQVLKHKVQSVINPYKVKLVKKINTSDLLKFFLKNVIRNLRDLIVRFNKTLFIFIIFKYLFGKSNIS